MERTRYLEQIKLGFDSGHPVVALLEPRQCGKTTLAKLFAQEQKGPTTLFDLENPHDLRSLEQPLLALKSLRGLIIIDEVQCSRPLQQHSTD